jgi:TolA-binding protein
MIAHECRSELVVRDRRGLLSPAERVALDAHLSACESCRVALELGRSFDMPETPELDDGARIQRLARAAETWTKRGRSPWRSVRARGLRTKTSVLLAACLVLSCGVAAAAFGTRPWLRIAGVFSPTPPKSEKAVESPRIAQQPAEVAVPPPAEGDAPGIEVPATADDVVPAARGPDPVTASKAHRAIATSSEPGEDAMATFRAANDARRRGESNVAVELYQKLERRFPASPEAQLSSVPLGELLLAANQPKAALEQFDRPSGGLAGTLRPEALYGRARSLAALGDASGEERAWRQLLKEFPKCPYAEAARHRLEPAAAPDTSGAP